MERCGWPHFPTTEQKFPVEWRCLREMEAIGCYLSRNAFVYSQRHSLPSPLRLSPKSKLGVLWHLSTGWGSHGLWKFLFSIAISSPTWTGAQSLLMSTGLPCWAGVDRHLFLRSNGLFRASLGANPAYVFVYKNGWSDFCENEIWNQLYSRNKARKNWRKLHHFLV